MTNPIVQRAKAHFSQQERNVVEVPEWPDDEGKPTLLYGSPLTLSEKQRVDNYREAQGRIAALAYTLILKAEDKAGAKLFTLDDRRALMNLVDADVISRIVVQLVSAPPDREAVEKN